MTEVRVGQMWAWNRFNVGTGSWFVTYATAEAIHSTAAPMGMIAKGDVFTVVSMDDMGPAQVPVVTGDGYVVAAPRMRWHVVLLHDRLCWFGHEWFDFCDLVGEAV